MEWTSAAKQTLHSYVAVSSGESPTSEIYQDLFTDLTAHIEEELHQKGIHEIKDQEIKSVLSSLGINEFHHHQVAPTPTLPRHQLPVAKKGCIASAGGFFTIILPLIALIIELAFHESKNSFFDPIPTWFHVVLIALVPTTFILISRFKHNLECYQDGDERKLKSPKIATFLLGFVLPTITYYALLFLPILPISTIACLVLVGLLPLAPIFCLVSWFPISIEFFKALRHTGNNSASKRLKYGIIAGLLCLTAVETPSYIRKIALENALSEDLDTQTSGINNIRRFGGEDQLLYHCYYGKTTSRGAISSMGLDPADWVWNFFSVNNKQYSTEQARELYYKVTGNPFNTVKPPASKRAYDHWEWESDNDHGGDTVAGRTKGLKLHSSRLDMHLDDTTKLGYVQWIIEFKNNNMAEKEARMQMALPHQGFVSKLTLWVNGEERPAAFSTVSKVKAAYKEIAVRQRLDPVLVNVSGADRAMLQCFPVPANGGIMKMKIGITFPIHANQSNAGHIDLPYIAERNFGISKDLKHAIYAQSDLEINAADSNKERTNKTTTLYASLPYASLKTERISWQDNTTSTLPVWTKDLFHNKGNDVYLVREIVPTPAAKEQAIIVVIDGSAPLKRWKPMLEKMIENKQSNIQFFVAGTGRDPLTPFSNLKELADIHFIGGIDNTPALKKALSLARNTEKIPTSILWIHGAQPVKFNTIASLEQDIERSHTTVPIYSVPLEDGENHILRAFKNSPHFYGSSRVQNAADLLQVIKKIHQPQTKISYSWKRTESPPSTGIKVWDQLARKWAYDKTISDWRKKSPTSEPNAAKLAAHYQLVTPLSGAVVLETKKQYLQTDLTPPSAVNSPSIPSSPEPSTALLMLLAGLYTLTRRNKSRMN